jgi:hypothetical protein
MEWISSVSETTSASFITAWSDAWRLSVRSCFSSRSPVSLLGVFESSIDSQPVMANLHFFPISFTYRHSTVYDVSFIFSLLLFFAYHGRLVPKALWCPATVLNLSRLRWNLSAASYIPDSVLGWRKRKPVITMWERRRRRGKRSRMCRRRRRRMRAGRWNIKRR